MKVKAQEPMAGSGDDKARQQDKNGGCKRGPKQTPEKMKIARTVSKRGMESIKKAMGEVGKIKRG